MADASAFGLLGATALLAGLSVNLLLLRRHAGQLVAALGFEGGRGQMVTLVPVTPGDPHVARLAPPLARPVALRLAA